MHVSGCTCTAGAYYNSQLSFVGVYERLTEQLIRETVSAALLAALHPRTAVTVSLQVLAGCNGTSAQVSVFTRRRVKTFLTDIIPLTLVTWWTTVDPGHMRQRRLSCHGRCRSTAG